MPRELKESDPKDQARGEWQRLRIAITTEVIHRDWGCALYTLHRTGRINNDQREAGDRYAALIHDYRKLWRDPLGFSIDDMALRGATVATYETRCKETQPVTHALGLALAESMADETELEKRRAQKISKEYKEARGLAGGINRALEELLIEEVWPATPDQHRQIGFALTRLFHFFTTGTKRER